MNGTALFTISRQCIATALRILYAIQTCSTVNLLDPSVLHRGVLPLGSDSARTLYAKLTSFTPRLPSRVVSGSKGHVPTLKVAIEVHLIVAVVVPIAADTMAGVAAGWVVTHHMPQADVRRQVRSTTQQPSDAVDPAILSVKSVASMATLEEWPTPELTSTPVGAIAQVKVAQECEQFFTVSEPQLRVFECWSHCLSQRGPLFIVRGLSLSDGVLRLHVTEVYLS